MMSNPNGISTRNLAWGVAGGRVTDERMTAHDALKQAGMLDWKVRKVELKTFSDSTDEDSNLIVPDKFATIRDTENGAVVLGTVGDRYNAWQNGKLSTSSTPSWGRVERRSRLPDSSVGASGSSGCCGFPRP